MSDWTASPESTEALLERIAVAVEKTQKPVEPSQCGLCVYYARFWNTTVVGNCRRHAPTKSNDLNFAVFPTMNETDWCGDFQPRKEESHG